MRPLKKLLPAVLLVSPAAAQLPYPPPSDGLPGGVEELCGGPVVPDLPPGEPWRAASAASDELPELPRWCDGTCVVDIAFIYGDDAIGGTWPDGMPLGPQTLGELRLGIENAVNVNNIAWRRAGLDARLRIVGVERDPAVLNDQGQELARTVRRLPDIRRRFGADLLYSIAGASRRQCGLANARGPATLPETAARLAAVGTLTSSCLISTALAHEVGHNLGLAHNPEDDFPQIPYVPSGHGYRKFDHLDTGLYGSIMASGEVRFFSTPNHLVRGRVLGNAKESDAVRALRYTIPDATRYSPTLVPEAQGNPKDYGCNPDPISACLNNWRFSVHANYYAANDETGQARALDLFGLGDSASLFYFFHHTNPELLVKVVNGCWLNDHYWVFGSAATDLKYEVIVGDLAAVDAAGEPTRAWYTHESGGVIRGSNGYSTEAGVISDTRAFPCKP